MCKAAFAAIHGAMDGKPLAPPRTMGLFGASLLPVNGMIGAGIFALPATLFLAVGDFAPWMILLGGLLFLPLTLTFAWLSARFEHSGGPILYGEAAFGRFVGFQAGWARYASAIVTVAANTHVMVSYLATLFPVLDGPVLRLLLVAGFIGFITIVNLFSLRSSVATLSALTAVKLLPLLALIVAGLFAGDPRAGLVLPEFTDAESVVLLTYYAFIGFEYVVLPAGEMKNPKRDVPLALVAMLGAVTLLYMLVIWAYIAIDPGVADGVRKPAGIGSRCEQWGRSGAIAIVIAAAFSIGANNFAGGISLPRMTFGMAERGHAAALVHGRVAKAWHAGQLDPVLRRREHRLRSVGGFHGAGFGGHADPPPHLPHRSLRAARHRASRREDPIRYTRSASILTVLSTLWVAHPCRCAELAGVRRSGRGGNAALFRRAPGTTGRNRSPRR